MTKEQAMERISATLEDGEALTVWVAHKAIKGRNMRIAVDGADSYEITRDGYKWTGHKWRHHGDLMYYYHERVVAPRATHKA